MMDQQSLPGIRVIEGDLPPIPTCDAAQCSRLAEFVWFGQYFCERHAHEIHARGTFRLCPWHGRFCNVRKTRPRISDAVLRLSRQAIDGGVA